MFNKCAIFSNSIQLKTDLFSYTLYNTKIKRFNILKYKQNIIHETSYIV